MFYKAFGRSILGTKDRFYLVQLNDSGAERDQEIEFSAAPHVGKHVASRVTIKAEWTIPMESGPDL